MRIPLFRPVVCEEAVAAVTEVLRSGWLGLGPKTAAFEQAFADYVGTPYCVALNSCTSALHLAMRVLALPPGSEVITTPITFVSTNHAILYERCRPVFADVEPGTGNLDVHSVSARIGERTKAIMLVHFGGYPCDLEAFYALAAKHGLAVIEDCAHACGASYRGRRIGSYGDLHAFSFHAVKNLAVGDGGALTVRRPDLYERLKRLRWMGIDRDTYHRSQPRAYHWDYDVTELGFKYHMNDVAAAVALEQLRHLDQQNAYRRHLAEMYREALRSVPGIRLPDYAPDRQSSHHLFWVLAEDRDGLVEKLRAAGVDVGVHYRRNDSYSMFEQCELPQADRFWRQVLSLPMHLMLKEEHIDYVTRVIASGWDAARRAA